MALKEILIFAGTTEGRVLSERLAAAGVRNRVCVATEYGELLVKSGPLVRVHRGRMGMEEIRKLAEEGDFGAVVDATHPYACVVSRNIKEAVEGMGIPYLRLEREKWGDGWERPVNGGREEGDEGCGKEKQGQVTWFANHKDCAAALEQVEGNILLTVGSKELGEYCISRNLRKRLYARVLPAAESLALCGKWGIGGRQIIAMQGPFSVKSGDQGQRQGGRLRGEAGGGYENGYKGVCDWEAPGGWGRDGI